MYGSYTKQSMEDLISKIYGLIDLCEDSQSKKTIQMFKKVYDLNPIYTNCSYRKLLGTMGTDMQGGKYHHKGMFSGVKYKGENHKARIYGGSSTTDSKGPRKLKKYPAERRVDYNQTDATR